MVAAVLPLMVLLRTVRKLPPLRKMPPPLWAAELLEKVIPSRVTLPEPAVTRPPPSVGAIPPEMVMPESVSLEVAQSKMRKVLAALGSRWMLSRAAPGPEIASAPPMEVN